MNHKHERHKRKKRRVALTTLTALVIALGALIWHLEMLVKGCEFAVITHTIFELLWLD